MLNLETSALIYIREPGHITTIFNYDSSGDAHMDLAFQLLILGHARTNVVMFILAGALSYFVDYRAVKGKPEARREAILVKTTAGIFVVGGLLLLGVFQTLTWFF